MAAVERRRTLSLSYFTARNAATNAELPSTLSYFFSHSEADYIYPITGGAYSTSPQLQLHLPPLASSAINRTSFSPSLSLPPFPPLYRCLPPFYPGLRREWLFPFGFGARARHENRHVVLVVVDGGRDRRGAGGGGEGDFLRWNFTKFVEMFRHRRRMIVA